MKYFLAAFIAFCLFMALKSFAGVNAVLEGHTIVNNGATLALPSSADTLVGRNSTDTMTNKTIDGGSNTFSNIPSSAFTGAAPCTVNTVSSVFSIPSTISKCYLLNVDTTGGAVTITLPNAIASAGYCVEIENVGGNAVNVNTLLSQAINGGLTDSLNALYVEHKYCAMSGQWFIH